MTKGYPRILHIIELYHTDRPCVICKEPNADQRVEIKFNEFHANNLRFAVHRKCIENMSKDEIMISLGICLNAPITTTEYKAWRLKLMHSGYGSMAKINLEVVKGILTPGAYPAGYENG